MLQSLRFEPTVDGFSPLHASAPAQQGEAPILGFLTSAPLALKRDKDALSSAFLSKLAPASNIPLSPLQCPPDAGIVRTKTQGHGKTVSRRSPSTPKPAMDAEPWISHGTPDTPGWRAVGNDL